MHPVYPCITLLLLTSSLEYAAESNATKSSDEGSVAMVAIEGGVLPGKLLPVDAFRISKHEVTSRQWNDVAAWASKNGYDIRELGSGSADNMPACSITWHEAVKWCNAKSEKEGFMPVYTFGGAVYKSDELVPEVSKNSIGYRLPSEDEWEWAALGGKNGKGGVFSGSNTIGDVSWYSENSSGEVKAVGTKAANEIGLHDMSGNVWEWCWDICEKGRSIRGGSSASNKEFCLVSSRLGINPTERLSIVGFRVASGPGK